MCAPGQGLYARTLRQISIAGRLQSIAPSSFRMRLRDGGPRGVLRLRLDFAARASAGACSARSRRRVRRAIRERAGRVLRRDWQRGLARIGPVSMPASISMIVTPVSSSPARIAPAIGEAPRQRGRSDG